MTLISYPLQVSGKGLATTHTDINKLREAVIMVINTIPGELVYQPDIGLDMELFTTHNDITRLMISVREALERMTTEIPGSTIELTAWIGDDGRLVVDVYYSVSGEDGNYTTNL